MTTRPAYAHVGRANGGDDEDHPVPEGPLAPAMRAALETRLEAVGFGRFDHPDILDAVAGVLGPDFARWQRIESAARAWHAARDDAISGGNWRPGPPMRKYEDACAVLAAVLTVTGGGGA